MLALLDAEDRRAGTCCCCCRRRYSMSFLSSSLILPILFLPFFFFSFFLPSLLPFSLPYSLLSSDQLYSALSSSIYDLFSLLKFFLVLILTDLTLFISAAIKSYSIRQNKYLPILLRLQSSSPLSSYFIIILILVSIFI